MKTNETLKVNTKDLGKPAVQTALKRLDKTIPIVVTDEPTTQSGSMTEDNLIDNDGQAPMEYLSNVIGEDGNVMEPFTVGVSQYQPIRAMKGRDIVDAFICLDDNRIYGDEDFRVNIANYEQPEYNILDLISLKDIPQGYRHFFVNKKTGDLKGKFRKTSDMLRSGITLSEDDDYMDAKRLKRFRFERYISQMNEVDGDTEGVEIDKLKSDVKHLTKLMFDRFGKYLAKLDKPIEQAQFLTAMAEMIGVPLNKLSTIVSQYRDIAKQDVTERFEKRKDIIRVMTVNEFLNG